MFEEGEGVLAAGAEHIADVSDGDWACGLDAFDDGVGHLSVGGRGEHDRISGAYDAALIDEKGEYFRVGDGFSRGRERLRIKQAEVVLHDLFLARRQPPGVSCQVYHRAVLDDRSAVLEDSKHLGEDGGSRSYAAAELLFGSALSERV